MQIPENHAGICISYGYKQRYVLYWLHHDSLYTKGFYCNIYLYMIDMYNHYANSHICCLLLEKDPIWFLGTKVKLVAWTLHRFYVLKLTHPLLYDDGTITHNANDIKRIFQIVESKILDGRSWSILGYWTLHHFHTQTLQSLFNRYDTSFIAAITFWRIYSDFWVQIWQVKVILRVLKAATDDFVSVG